MNPTLVSSPGPWAVLAPHTWSAVGSLVDKAARTGGNLPAGPGSSPQGLPSVSHEQESSDLCWSSVAFRPRKVKLESNVICPEKLKATVAFKDTENEGRNQIFFLGRPQILVGFPSYRHSKRAEGEARALPGRLGLISIGHGGFTPGAPALQWKLAHVLPA